MDITQNGYNASFISDSTNRGSKINISRPILSEEEFVSETIELLLDKRLIIILCKRRLIIVNPLTVEVNKI